MMETQEDADISDRDMAKSSFGNHNKRPLTSPAPNERTNKTPRNGPSPKKPDINMDKFNELHDATDTLTASLTSDNLMEKRTRNALMDWVTKIANLVSDNIKETSSTAHDVETLRTDLTNDQNEMNKVTLSSKWEKAMIESSKLVKLRDVDLKKDYDDAKDPRLADSLYTELSDILAPLGRENIGKPSIIGKAKADGKRDVILSFNTPEEAFRVSLDIEKNSEIKISQSKHYGQEFFHKISEARKHLKEHLGKNYVMYRPTRDGKKFTVKTKNDPSEQWEFAGLTGYPFDTSESRMCGGWSPFLLHGMKVPEVVIPPLKKKK